MADKTHYYECPSCSCYHIVGFSGSCEDTNSAFLDTELDEIHGVGGWDETFESYNPEPSPEPIVSRRNYDRVMAISEGVDVEGNKLEPGCNVRCFAARYDDKHDWLIGMDTIGRCSYFDGELLAIEDHDPNRPQGFDKGRYYKIAITKSVAPLVTRTHNNFEITNTIQTTHYRDGHSNPVFIEVNGTETEDGMRTFGVVRIVNERR